MRNVSYPQACADCLGIERCTTGCICPGCNVVSETSAPQWEQLAPVMRELTKANVGWNWSMYRNERCCITEVFAGNDAFLEVTYRKGVFEVWEDRPTHSLELVWKGESADGCNAFVLGRAVCR